MKIYNNFKIKFLKKAYTEGVYADTPQNRKLGRVGMSYGKNDEKQNKEEAIKTYQSYLEGGGLLDEEKYSKMDLLFSPSKNSFITYRGTTTEELDDILERAGVSSYKQLVGKTIENNHYSSTTQEKRYADDYASDIYDLKENNEDNEYFENLCPVRIKMNIEEKTPIINRKEYGGDTIGRGGSSEITIGKGVKWTIIKAEKSFNSRHNCYEYDIEVNVKAK